LFDGGNGIGKGRLGLLRLVEGLIRLARYGLRLPKRFKAADPFSHSGGWFARSIGLHVVTLQPVKVSHVTQRSAPATLSPISSEIFKLRS